MKSTVKFSSYALVLTLIINLILIGCCVYTFKETVGFWFVFGILVMLLLLGLLFGPVQIVSDNDYITVKSILRKRRIPVCDIESVELFQPTMGAIRLCASGGYFGYWGLFREGDVGRYEAYYGKASDCFLIKMKNGSKYVLGCQNPSEMVDKIQTLLT